MSQDESRYDIDRVGAAFDRTIGNVANSTLVAILTAATGSPDVSALYGGIAGPIAEELSFTTRLLLRRANKRMHRLISEAEVASGLSPEELSTAFFESDRKAALYERTISASVRSATDEKVDMMARVLASGALADDDAVVDRHLIAIDVIDQIEIPHLRIMQCIRSPSPSWQTSAERRSALRFSWRAEDIAKAQPGLSDVLPALLAKIVALGVANSSVLANIDESVWTLTTFGIQCLDDLGERAKLLDRGDVSE